MTKRIFFKRYDSTGKFPDGRTRLDVHFEDSQDSKYVWTPDWKKGTRNLFLEAYRVEKLNRLRGREVDKFKQVARAVSSDGQAEEVKNYQEVDGRLDRLEKGRIVVHELVFETTEFGIPDVFSPKTREWKIPLSVEFHTKIMEETRNLLNWVRRHKGDSGKWAVVNGGLFDVEWEKRS